jgi:hypothetical protein
MAEYITKKAAIKAVENAPIELFQSEWEEIEEAINAVPAADVVPVVHGRWTTKHYIDGIFEGTNFDECSACGYQRVFDDPALKTRYDYCPRCGAKMDGGAE